MSTSLQEWFIAQSPAIAGQGGHRRTFAVACGLAWRGLDFTHALELNPDLAVSYMNRGLTFEMKGDETKAQQDFDRCLQLKPEFKAELDRRMAMAKELRKP